MAVTILRHEFPTDHAERGIEVLTKGADNRMDSLEESPRSFNRALNTTLTLAQAHCLIDPTAAKLPTWEAYVSAMQVGSAMFAAAMKTEGTVQCRIADKLRTIQATGPQYYTDAGNWINAFWLAIICREQGRMTELCNVPLSLLRASGAVYDEYIYAWVDTLQTYWRESPGMWEKLVAAVDGTEPDVLRDDTRDLVLRILYPPISLFHLFVRQEHDRFNEELVNALQWHKDYWIHDEERATDSAGLVAIGPLAIACLAYDAGFPIEVESEYLPKHLLVRSWVGEFET